MKFLFWSGWSKRKEIDTAVVAATMLSTPAAPKTAAANWRTAPPPMPMPVNPAVRSMETALSVLVYRVTETLAKTELYFPSSDLQMLGLPSDNATLCEKTDRQAQELLHRTDVSHAERYVTQTAEVISALHTAQQTAILLRLICSDEACTAALPILRRVADSCERVIRHSARVLEAPATEVFTWSNSVVAGQNEIQTAVHKAITMLEKKPALLAPTAQKMVRAAIWSMEISAGATAHAALECRGVVLPASLTVREPEPHPGRYAPGSHRSYYASV